MIYKIMMIIIKLKLKIKLKTIITAFLKVVPFIVIF